MTLKNNHLCLRKLCFLFFLLSFLLPFFSTAQEKKFSIEAGPEYRNEDFRWSIAGNQSGTNPNILSELIFKPIQSAGFYANGKYQFAKKFSAEVSYNRLYTYEGEVTDIDYNGDNRTNPRLPMLHLQSNKGFMRTVNFGVNYYPIKKQSINLLTGLGYNSTKEMFYLTDFNNEALNSSYSAKWNGHYAKVSILYQPIPELEITGEIKYNDFNVWPDYINVNTFNKTKSYPLHYYGEANWNLIADFQHPISFTHSAKGHGFDYRLSLGLNPSKSLKVTFHGLYSDWKTNYGVDELYKSDGSSIKARMNGAFKKNIGIRFTTTFLF